MTIKAIDDTEIDAIYNSTKEHLEKAKSNLVKVQKSEVLNEAAISNNVVPGYDSEELDFGAYAQDRFAVLFVDIRCSTERAQRLGPEKTFLTMHIFIPALLRVIELYDGYPIDIMGDGIMVFFKNDETVINRAAFCGWDIMYRIKDGVINKLLNEEGIDPINIGIGITCGNVVVTKIGLQSIYDVKVFGDCVNKAAHYSDGCNKIKVSEEIEAGWPSGPDGRLRFTDPEDDGSRTVIVD